MTDDTRCPAECSVVEASGILIVTNRYRCVLPPHDHEDHDWRRKPQETPDAP